MYISNFKNFSFMQPLHKSGFILALPVILVILMTTLNSCRLPQTDCIGYDYSNCSTIKPIRGTIYIRLTIDDQYKAVPVRIFQGKLEDNVILMSDTLREDTWSVILPVEQYYTVAAYYTSGGKTTMAIDGGKIGIRSTVQCDSTCFEPKEARINVELKYK